MNIADFSIRKSTVTWFLTVLLIAGGMNAYTGLGKLEDPTFTIKTAVVTTTYPGASPGEVENEVTALIESAAQELGQTDKVRSLSMDGVSMVYVDIKDTYTARDLPQVWDELRRKVSDAQPRLPPGAGPSVVNDDYGDVFGVYYALTGEGFTLRELEDQADLFRRELLLVPGVANVEIDGVQRETIYLEVDRTRMASLGIAMEEISGLLKAENIVAGAGSVAVGPEYIRISPTGYFDTLSVLQNLLLRGGSGQTIFLGDLAKIYRGYTDPPQNAMRFNGKPALGIGVSNADGGNVIVIGEAVKKKISGLASRTPAGMEMSLIYYQADTVRESIRNFLVNLAEAIAIVIAILLVFMGMQSGLLIGAMLLLTILATFIAMKAAGIDLQSISLGALIIALGMLVDNAIVVADGILVGVQKGERAGDAAIGIVGQTQMPLLGATLIAVIAFAPIGTSPDSTGEYCRSLFQVVGISLLLSWIVAVTVTPLAGIFMIRPARSGTGENTTDPYDTGLYRMYRGFLRFCLGRRRTVVLVVLALLAVAAAGFGKVDKSFFPNSTSPMFTVDFWSRRGTGVEATLAETSKIADFLSGQPETKSVTSFAGKGALRFVLTYTPGDPVPNYGHLIVETKDAMGAEALKRKLREFVLAEIPHLDPRICSFSKGTGGGAKVQVRFLGENALELRNLRDQAISIFKSDPDSINVRDTWGERVKVIRPVLADSARELGLTRMDVADALKTAYSGLPAGIFREGEKIVPIIIRLPSEERGNAESLEETQIWSSLSRRYIPLAQAVSSVEVAAEDPVIYRRNRLRVMTVEADSGKGMAGAFFRRIQGRMEALPLPPGTTMEWGGEFESSSKARGGLMKMIPLSFLAILAILVVLFNGLRQVLIIVLCLPLSIIGVSVGLLATGRSFDFLALLGFLSLAGMLIKNAIVLMDQIDLEMREGKSPFDAILDSGVSRCRPVMMAALTTVLGMVPLYFDVLFSALAVTVMFGLTFASVLTLVIVPVLYAEALRA